MTEAETAELLEAFAADPIATTEALFGE